jgi:hypothetical protein
MQKAKDVKVKGVEVVTVPRLNTLQKDGSARRAFVARLASNLQAIYTQATPAEIQDGVLWYARARGFCASLARTYKTNGRGFALTPARVAHIVAALSPNNSWTRNQLDTVTVLNAVREGLAPEAVKVCTYHPNKARAFALARGESFAELKGDKVRAFADNIARANSEAVTIDLHAYNAALGVRVSSAESKGVRSPWYVITADAYRQAANALGLSPCELQAVVWVTWRRLAGVHAVHG